MHLKAETLDDLLIATFERLLKRGKRITATRGETYELQGVLLELSDPRARLSRTESKGKVFSSLGELLWYLSGTNSLEFIKYYLPKYEDETEDGATIFGGYGPRLIDHHGHNQIENVLKLLKGNSNSRRAVIQVFDAADISRTRKEIPCTCTIQFLLREEKLNAIVHMRSNDAYFGLPHDVFAFTFLQEIIARSLGAGLGTYKHFVGSLHLYSDYEFHAHSYIGEAYQPTTKKMPPMPPDTPWQSIEKILKIESKLRADEPVLLSQFSLDSYWLDLARILQFFAASRGPQMDEIEMERLKSELAGSVYEMYLNGRTRTIGPPNLSEPTLPLLFDRTNK
ncbi:thymidylate synthase [Rhodobiaceae bacterium]|nr:thymidylate synthase [Rhodobiaceae bacterium]